MHPSTAPNGSSRMCAEAGVKLMYVPPYSSDLNPIEGPREPCRREGPREPCRREGPREPCRREGPRRPCRRDIWIEILSSKAGHQSPKSNIEGCGYCHTKPLTKSISRMSGAIYILPVLAGCIAIGKS